jgi:hypothetical protein
MVGSDYDLVRVFTDGHLRNDLEGVAVHDGEGVGLLGDDEKRAVGGGLRKCRGTKNGDDPKSS